MVQDLFTYKIRCLIFFILESWSSLFQRLFEGNAAGSMFLYEKKKEGSIVKHGDGTIESIAHVFPYWLTSIAFDPNGLVMKHAMDVAIMLDTLGHDDRLGLEYLIPVSVKCYYLV